MSATSVVSTLALKNILFPTDFSTSSSIALPYARSLALRYGASLNVLHVMPPEVPSSIPLEPMPPLRQFALSEAQKHMDLFLGGRLQRTRHEVSLRQGYFWAVIDEAIHSHSIDLIVLGTHGHGALHQLLMGSSAEEIFRKADCPVLTIGPRTPMRGEEPLQFRTILFATDFSNGSRNALPIALALQHEHGADLHLLHVVEPGSVPTELAERTLIASEQRLKAMLPAGEPLWVTPKLEVRVGTPGHAICRYAADHNADLIIMGMHRGSAATAHVPWAVAHYVVAHALSPVLTLRAHL